MLTTSAVLSDPNISSRVDGAGIREGVPVAIPSSPAWTFPAWAEVVWVVTDGAHAYVGVGDPDPERGR